MYRYEIWHLFSLPWGVLLNGILSKNLKSIYNYLHVLKVHKIYIYQQYKNITGQLDHFLYFTHNL